MKYSCPYCDGIGSVASHTSKGVIKDGEVCIAVCKNCKKEFSVAHTISEASEIVGTTPEDIWGNLFGIKLNTHDKG